ncbi:MAG: class II aldolase/adducin family protein [Thermoprotei archaeon]|nr:MAG: class II aldolase/adducin family protein [Thermoprotei archaeon]
MLYESLAKEVVFSLRRLYELGLVSSFSGNVSARVSDDAFLITPSGVHRSIIDEKSLILMRNDGVILRKGRFRPSSEWRMHALIYETRKDVYGIVHAHPRSVVAASLLGINLEGFAEIEIFFRNKIAIVPPLKPGSLELAKAVAEVFKEDGVNSAILHGHGAVTVAESPLKAEGYMEVLEEVAEILLKKFQYNK